MRLPWERRHRDGGRSDFRDDRVGEPPHLGPIGDEDAGNVTPSGALCVPSGPRSGPGGHAVDLRSGRRTSGRPRLRDCWTTREEGLRSRRLRDGV